MDESIKIPDGVSVEIEDKRITVKGPKGHVEKNFDDPRFNSFVTFEKTDDKIFVKNSSEKRKMKAFAGTIRAHIKNMIKGVTVGYKYSLKIVYTHFPMSVTIVKDEVHVKNYLGEKGARIAKIKGNVKIHVDKEDITITGTNVEDVGQTSANIERSCKLRGRDRRIFQDGIYITHRQMEDGEKV